MRGIRAFAAVAMGVVTGAAGLVIAASTPAAANPAAYNCPDGWFCIYSDWNGNGTKCQWSQRELRNTADNCSFIQRGQNVRSLWNNTNHRKQYYTQTNFKRRIGSTLSHEGGNLQGNYQIRSFKPQ